MGRKESVIVASHQSASAARVFLLRVHLARPAVITIAYSIHCLELFFSKTL